MISKAITLSNSREDDLNAALLVQTASDFASRIHVTFLNKTVNAKSIMGVMTLPLENGNTVTVLAEGKDEERALSALENFFTGK